MTKLVKDDAGEEIQLLGYRRNAAYIVPFLQGVSNTSPQLSTQAKIVTITLTADAFLEIGNSSVTSSNTTSHYLLASTPYDIAMGSSISNPQVNRYIAVTGSTTAGIAYISERG